jgi:hypothetical protein
MFVAIFLAGLISAWNIHRRARLTLTREVSIAVFCTWALAPLLLFFYRVLEFRVYAFFFWLLPAMMLSLFAYERRPLPIEDTQLTATT